MAAGSLGGLVVSLEANIANFTRDMGRASAQTDQAMKSIQGSINVAKKALEYLGIGASIGGVVMFGKSVIDAADNLRDMSMKTGIAVETLNGLGFAAGQAGGNLESMVASAGKLNKSIVEAAGGNKDVGEAFSKLGISVRDANGHLKTADVVMAEVADKFKTYADGPEKSAIALRIFGKAGADMIPLLNDGGDAMRDNIEYAKKYSGATQELSDAADNFNDSMGKLAIQQKGFGNAMATAVLPVLQAMADELLSASEQSDKFALASNVVRTVLETFVVVGSEVAFTFSQIGTGIGGAIARLDALKQGDFKGFSVIGDMMEADLANAKTKHDAFIANVLDRTPKFVQSVTDGWDDGGPKKSAPMLRAKGDDPTKALLDGQLKAMEDGYAKERDVASFHEKFMQELRAQDIVDLQTYQAFKTASIEQGLASAIRTYDAEIAALEKARAAAAKATDRAEIDNKIKDKQALKEKARLDAMQAITMQTLSLSAAQSELNKSMKEWVIQQDQAALQLQFEIDMFGKSTLEVAKLTAARRIQLDVEERIRQAKKNGDISDETVAKIQADAAIAKAKSDSLYDQADTKQRDPWANMQAAVTRYGEEASNVGAQIGNAMTGAFRGAEDAFVQFTMTGKLNFKDMASSILADIARIEARKAVAGFVSMAVGGIGSMFGQPSSGAGSTGWDGYGNTLPPPRASGGPVSGGASYLVGERGPEIFLPSSSGTIIPNSGIGGSGGIQVNTSITLTDSGASSETSGDSSNKGRALADLINTQIKDVLMRETRQGGILWNQQMRGFT